MKKEDVNKMEKCKSCINFDKEKSNANWTVCRKMPVAVMMSKDSSECENFKPHDLSAIAQGGSQTLVSS